MQSESTIVEIFFVVLTLCSNERGKNIVFYEIYEDYKNLISPPLFSTHDYSVWQRTLFIGIYSLVFIDYLKNRDTLLQHYEK